ncbi:dual specificity protein phosphatase 14-like [Gigantopelta aegis]|uniref:dual specificity protein phosphatase 14-like n=1 Tax=Gigantopelta aegis TaxID=1735272 RepID=UPI001B88C42A|nr:dual specificity protein phosphatase 14-like [Gigantopelta aegis]
MDCCLHRQIAHITDHLFLSSAAAVSGERVCGLNITNVINCTMDIPNLHMPGIDCIQIHVDDLPNANLSLYFDSVSDKIAQIHQRGGKTLVHCVAGVRQSASLCIAYLMKYYHKTLEDAYRHVKQKRLVIHPNFSFWSQLIQYERRIFRIEVDSG